MILGWEHCLLWPLPTSDEVIATLESRGIFDFEDIDDEHDLWTDEAREAQARAQADPTGETNPYLLTLELTEEKYSHINSENSVKEIAERFAVVFSCNDSIIFNKSYPWD